MRSLWSQCASAQMIFDATTLWSHRGNNTMWHAWISAFHEKKNPDWCNIPGAEALLFSLTCTGTVLSTGFHDITPVCTLTVCKLNECCRGWRYFQLQRINFCTEKRLILIYWIILTCKWRAVSVCFIKWVEMKVTHCVIQTCSVSSEGIYFCAALHNNNSRSFVSI